MSTLIQHLTVEYTASALITVQLSVHATIHVVRFCRKTCRVVCKGLAADKEGGVL